MEELQQKLIREELKEDQIQLLRKIKKSKRFLESEAFKKYTAKQKYFFTAQLAAMKSYYFIITLRLEEGLK